MLDRERLYKDLASVLGGEEQEQVRPQGIFLPATTALVWVIAIIFMLAWIGADIFDAVHAQEAIIQASYKLNI